MELMLIIWLLSAGVGALVAGPKGAIMGFLLGPLGVIIACVMPKEENSDAD